MRSIVTKGKDVKEALDLGLEMLGLTKEQVEIEVMDREKKGLFRIGSKPAIIRITEINDKKSREKSYTEDDILHLIDTTDVYNHTEYINEEEIQSDIETDKDKLPGKVWVKDGKVYSKSGNLRYPTVQKGKGCQLFINEKELLGTTVVTENDLIEIKVDTTTKETEWNLTVDSNKLKVEINVSPGYKVIKHIPDIEPDEHIIIHAEEQKEVMNTLSYEKVIGELNRLGVRHGFNHMNIMKAIETSTKNRFEIVTGVEPKKGKNGWLEILIEINNQDGPKERSDGTVDYREIRTFSSVKKGDVIGIVHDPVPGVPGITITNEPIPPKQTFPIIIKEGKGVIGIEDGKKIVATESGRPHIKQRGLLYAVAVMPKLVRNGDVDLESGNIRFKGDVDINGNVNDGMVVEGEGDIFITENVTRSIVTSNNAIQICNNVIGSTIYAGKSNMMITELGQILGNVTLIMKKMMISMEQLFQSPAFKLSDYKKTGIQPLIRILMERKFRELPVLLKRFCELAEKDDNFLEEEWVALAVEIRGKFLGAVKSEFMSFDYFRLLEKRMVELYEMSKAKVEPNAYVTAMYALNSVINSSGNVTIYGQGCYNTKIHSGGKLQINGLLRGGEIFGRFGIEVNEVGSDTAVLTKLSVPSDQTIIAKKVMEGTIFQIGSVKYKFYKEKKHVKASLSRYGQIQFN